MHTDIFSLATQMVENFTSPWYGDFKLSPDGKFNLSSRIEISFNMTQSLFPNLHFTLHKSTYGLPFSGSSNDMKS